MTIRKRVILISCLCIIMIVAAGTNMVLVGAGAKKAIQTENQVEKIKNSLYDLNIITSDYLLSFGKRPKQQWIIKNSEFLQRLRKLANFTSRISSEKNSIIILQENHSKLAELFDKLSNIAGAGNIAIKSTKETFPIKNELSAQLLLTSRKMLEVINRISNKQHKKRDLFHKRMVYTAWSVIVILVVFLLGLLFWTRSAVLKPLALLQKGAEEIAKGKYGQEVIINTKDELQSLAHSFNEMSYAVKANITKLNEEINERKHVEEELTRYRNHLEELVKERTAELRDVNEQLQVDIIKRKQVEEALLQSEARYKGITNYTNNGVAVYQAVDNGEDFIFLDFNEAAEKIEGVKSEDLIGKSVCEVFPSVKDFGLFKIFQQVWKTGKAEHFPISLYQDNKILGWRENFVYKLPSGEIVAVYTDETERKQADEDNKKLENRLQSAQRLESVGTLAGGIAHNFNNILTSIVGNASLLLMDIDSEHPHHENLTNIEKQVKNGSKLTAQLIAFAREGRYEVKPISLNQVVQETSNTFDITRKEVVVHQELDDKLHGIKADKGQIEQFLLNLCVNAADAMPGGGNLFLKTQNVTHKDMGGKPYDPKPGNYTLLTVRDDGAGMDKETMERIFEPFFTTKGFAEGTGLGLASAYGIIKAHGGYIDVDSEKGHGTTFSIYLPATKAAANDEKKLPDKIVKGKESVLMVDDEEMVLNTGKRILKKLGYEVLAATSGIGALELYEKNQDKIDMVLLDMVMPVMGGGETYDKMRQINSHIKVLLVSGYSIEGEAENILERGCDGFIQKPFSIEELSNATRKILDKGNE